MNNQKWHLTQKTLPSNNLPLYRDVINLIVEIFNNVSIEKRISERFFSFVEEIYHIRLKNINYLGKALNVQKVIDFYDISIEKLRVEGIYIIISYKSKKQINIEESIIKDFYDDTFIYRNDNVRFKVNAARLFLMHNLKLTPYKVLSEFSNDRIFELFFEGEDNSDEDLDYVSLKKELNKI